MMRTRPRSTSRTPTSGPTRNRRLASAATMLPLAIGLAANMSTPGAGPQAKRGVVTPPACTLPFGPIQMHHPIDDSCPASGNASVDNPKQKAQALQNEAKNNFCAVGAPANIDFEVLHQLQQDAENARISFGNDSQIPPDRSVLRNLSTKAGPLGEGTVARLAAFVIKAHYSNVGVGKGESVNCKLGDKESNDIHIVLGEKSNKDAECSSATAEMSPHFRPDVWDPSVLMDHNEHLYRFTGQLFFDASHKPCSEGKGSPKRSAIWEIHPVYGVDICTAPTNNCTVENDQDWIPLSDFIGTGTPSNETHLRLPEEISSEFQAADSARSASKQQYKFLTGE